MRPSSFFEALLKLPVSAAKAVTCALRRAPWRSRDDRNKTAVAVWAIVIALFAGAIELALPAEDAFRAVRAQIRMHPADQQVVVVAVDDASLNVLGADQPPRDQDARLIERLLDHGAKRIFFDRAYADPTDPVADQKLRSVLERHKGRIFFGAFTDIEQSDGSLAHILPHPRFRDAVEIVSIEGEKGPFGLSVRFPTHAMILGKEHRSMSAELARLEHGRGQYRPDFAIDYQTIPTINYIDALSDDADSGIFAGRDVVVAPSSRTSADFHPMPFRGYVPGVYFHVIGAETLKRGMPIDLGWLPPLALVALVMIWQAGRSRPSWLLLIGTCAGLIIIPLGLDHVNVNVDVMPAALCLAIAQTRLHRIAARNFHGSTGLRRIKAMQSKRLSPDEDVYALKIRNFAAMSALLSPEEIEELLSRILSVMKVLEPDSEIAFHKDTLVWTRPKLSAQEVRGHIEGIHAVLRKGVSVGDNRPDLATSIGVDISYDVPIRERSENAIQCAENASLQSILFVIGDRNKGGADRWQLQILSEMETAIHNEEVELLYQPKVDLRTRTIVGAEALLRWHHKLRGQINIEELMALAESHQRTDQVTRWVLGRALSDANKAIGVCPLFKVAVNVSVLDLQDPIFPPMVEQLIAAHRVPARNLVLEVTETFRSSEMGLVADSITQLRRMGVEISIDDFGVGVSNFERLSHISFDEVKIDRSFVMDMETDEEKRIIVKSAISLARSLNKRVVAEGVETRPMMELLARMECDQAQGFLFSRPVTMTKIIEALQTEAEAA
ncbi:hypothetical protein MACH24_31010 [Erythrobacter sp. Dej080120_24]|uniref:EAL domain-containing protein n=1 Tax=Erythrobacter sp. Dej080120_24 TaxID=3024837 RepID=UPI00291DF242|nr:hypothetical protein MACH24_31010 [Erythrobacter sp. Dej080120_24]